MKSYKEQQGEGRILKNFDIGISKMLCGFIYGIIGFSLFSFLVCIMVFSVKYHNEFSFREIVWIFPAVALLFIIFFCANWLQKKKKSYMFMFLTGIQIIIATVMILSYNTQPCSDYQAIWNAANEMAQNRFTDGLNPGAYMYYYNWQIGMAAFESILIRVFGSSFMALKIINAVLLMLINYLIYMVAYKKCGGGQHASHLSLPYFLCPMS